MLISNRSEFNMKPQYIVKHKLIRIPNFKRPETIAKVVSEISNIISKVVTDIRDEINKSIFHVLPLMALIRSINVGQGIVKQNCA